MKTTTILSRSPKGQEEIEHREHKLAGKMRMLLFLVDGHLSLNELTEKAQRMGLGKDAVSQLLAGGFISIVKIEDIQAANQSPPADKGQDAWERYRRARQFMNETIVDAIGIKSFFFTLKIERTSNLEELRSLLNDYTTSMLKALGQESGDLFVSRMKKLLE